MKRLCEVNINTPELSDTIFRERWRECPHWVDWDRFSLLVKYFSGKGKYLDIGCFNSPMPFELTQKYKEEVMVYAIDHAPQMIAKMRQLFPEVLYSVVDVYKLPFKQNYFDYVVAGEVIEHLEKPQEAINEWFSKIKQGGWLALSTPEKEAQEGRTGISQEHLWSYNIADIYNLLCQYGKPEIESYRNMLVAWCKKI